MNRPNFRKYDKNYLKTLSFELTFTNNQGFPRYLTPGGANFEIFEKQKGLKLIEFNRKIFGILKKSRGSSFSSY